MLVYTLKLWALLTAWIVWFCLALSRKKNADDRFVWFSIVPVVLSLMVMNVI